MNQGTTGTMLGVEGCRTCTVRPFLIQSSAAFLKNDITMDDIVSTN